MNKNRIVKILGFGLLGLTGLYLIFSLFLILSIDKCTMLDEAISSKNKQVAAFWNFYLDSISSFSADHVCFPGQADKRPLTLAVGVCATLKNYPLCEEVASRILKHGADINANDLDLEFGLTALHEAVLGLDVRMVQLLLQNGADTSHRATGTKFFNKTPLELIPMLRQTKSEEADSINEIENALTKNRTK